MSMKMKERGTEFDGKTVSESYLFVCILHVSNFPSRNQMDLNKGTEATADADRRRRSKKDGI